MYTFEQVVNNVETLYIESGKPKGSNWFYEAHDDVQVLADEQGIPFVIAAAVVATLSPRLKWHTQTGKTPNIDAARALIKGFRHKQAKTKVFKNVAGFDHNKIKAWAILRTHDVSYCSGPKVWAFFQNIVDPSNDNYLTIDSWMTCIGLGIDITRGKDAVAPTKKQHEFISDALRVVAYGHGMDSAMELQACLWVYAKAKAGRVDFRLA